MEEVARSIRVSSTQILPGRLETLRATGFALGGLIAGEGSFIVTTKQPPFVDGSPKLRFVLQVSMAERDESLLGILRQCLGFGSIHRRPPERDEWPPMSVFTVASRTAHHAATIPFCEAFLLPSAKRQQSLRELVAVVVPFMDAHLPPSYKRERYLVWRARLFDYWEHKAKRVRPCTVEGCNKPRRAHGLCWHHLYQQYRMCSLH